MRFRFITVAWGDRVSMLLNLTLPSLLTDGNLLALRGSSGSTYQIFTDAASVPELQASETLRALASIMAVEISIIDTGTVLPDERGDKYTLTTRCNQLGTRQAAAEGSAGVYLGDAVLYSDGSLRALFRAAATGKRAVLVPSYHVHRESFYPAFVRAFGGASVSRPLPSRALAELTLRYLHRRFRTLLWDGDALNHWTSILCWNVGQSGLLSHWFHLHPIMVIAPADPVEWGKTVDDRFLENAVPNPDDLTILSDSDDVLCVKPQPYGVADVVLRRPVPMDAEQRFAYVAGFMAAHTSPSQRRYFRIPARLHVADLDPSWAAVQASAAVTVERLLQSVCEQPQFIASAS